jgi:phage baseplate assembly protein gpV
MSKFITSDPPYNAGLYPTTDGFLELANGVALSATLTNVTDQLNTLSALYLSTNKVRIGRGTDDTSLVLFGTKSYSAIFNTSLMLEADRTFTFPNASMTFAGINVAQTFTVAQTFNSPSASDTDGSPIRILTHPWTTGNGNQNHPLLLFGPHGGNIWAASPNGGTYIGINAVASFPGNFLDFHVSGGASVFKVSSAGALTSTSTITGTGFNVTGIGGRYSFEGSQYIDGTTLSGGIFYRSNAAGHRFNVNGTVILNILSTGLTLASGDLTVSNGNMAISGKVTSTGGYAGVAGNIIPSFESSVTYGAASGNANFRPVSISYSISNTGPVSGTATGIFLNGTETGGGLNGMTHNLIDLQRNGAIRFRVDNTGRTTIGPGGPGDVKAITFYPNKSVNGEEVTAIGNAGFDASMFFSGGSGTTNFFNGAFSDRVGVNIGTTTNTRGALLRLGAGAAAANSAPLKFTAGTNLTTPENGAFEFDGSFLYFTIGGVRLKVTLAP